ncbi:MAG: hypothetical protein KDC05_10025 [Bacteroidales bacterium]|nr:hypothetical protein [Bacteroidales bacterium]
MARVHVLLVLLFMLVFGTQIHSQTYRSKTFAYFDDYIITKKDTIFGRIDEKTIHGKSIEITLTASDKTQKIKASKIIELKSRFLYKRIPVEGDAILMKVLTEGPVSLYSIEKRGVSVLSDKEPRDFTPTREVPSKSTFYLKKGDQLRQLERENYKAVLKDFLNPDEKLSQQIDAMEFQELEFRLLNMVIGYNFKQEE